MPTIHDTGAATYSAKAWPHAFPSSGVSERPHSISLLAGIPLVCFHPRWNMNGPNPTSDPKRHFRVVLSTTALMSFMSVSKATALVLSELGVGLFFVVGSDSTSAVAFDTDINDINAVVERTTRKCRFG